MTSGPLLATRARHLERVLYQQGARHVELFAEIEAENTTLLPEAARLQELLQCNTRRGGCQGGVLHVAQKHLELLWTLGSRARRPHLPRWVVVADDDTFLWVNRWVKALANFNDTRPLFVGGGGARTHMCGPRLCDKARYVSQWRFIPQVNTHGGGMGYALTMPRSVGCATRLRAAHVLTLASATQPRASAPQWPECSKCFCRER